jgi:hypothetical protein
MPEDYKLSKGELLSKLHAKLTGLTDEDIDVENIRRRLPSGKPLVFADKDPDDPAVTLDADGDWTSKGDGDGDPYQTLKVERP